MTREEIKNTPEIVDFLLDESVTLDSRMKLHKRLEELCKLANKALEEEPKIGNWILSGGYWRCSECKEKALLKLDKAKGGRREYEPVRSKHCPSCGTKMEEVKE